MDDSASDDYPPLSALNHLLYCERRCALLRIENVWVENAHTLSGALSHQRADKPVTWKTSDGATEVHGMWLKSDQLRLVGKADIVEFHPVVVPPSGGVGDFRLSDVLDDQNAPPEGGTTKLRCRGRSHDQTFGY